ncbi:hypothetical protein K504DRAFT_518063 [Pleomassaria siparia CBS 279.74]|uniref:Uncharacterized protein n=1 Tax=Pleomassaria siparia CBS 279.74 TaxID=1314801 RepID=A0A6G1KM77_9PLEO|nr:hypothetical protein K504DRAFT_518063 [Pleomassaria siparia CBS 279.74]
MSPVRKTATSAGKGKKSGFARAKERATSAIRKTSLNNRLEQASRVTKKVGRIAKFATKTVPRKIVRIAKTCIEYTRSDKGMNTDMDGDIHTEVDTATGMDIDVEMGAEFAVDMDVDIDPKKEIFQVIKSGFEHWSSEKGYHEFVNQEKVAAAKEFLQHAKDELDLVNPTTVDLRTVWNLADIAFWSEFLENNAETKEQKGLKKVVDSIRALICDRKAFTSRWDRNTNIFFFPTE